MMDTQIKSNTHFEIDIREYQKSVYLALDLFLLHHSHLVTHHTGKWSITHKLAESLQTLFPTCYVDCNYPICDIKEIAPIIAMREKLSVVEQDRTTVCPDIIIHNRDTTTPLLIIEVQPSLERTYSLKRFTENKVETYLKQRCTKMGLNLLLNTDKSLQQPYITTWHLHLANIEV